MAAPTLILLPGMHGTADYWPWFLPAVPEHVPRRILTFPTDECLDYDDLLRRIEDELADETDMVVLGESFSGPLAVRFAARHPARVRAAVLSGSFVVPPLPRWMRVLSRPWLFRMPLPDVVIRFAVAGRDASDAFVATVRYGIRQPTPAVLAHRGRCVLSVDCTDDLPRCRHVVCLAPQRDHMVWRWNVNPIRRARPDAAIITLDGPHLILQARPEAAWQALAPHLETLDATLDPRA